MNTTNLTIIEHNKPRINEESKSQVGKTEEDMKEGQNISLYNQYLDMVSSTKSKFSLINDLNMIYKILIYNIIYSIL